MRKLDFLDEKFLTDTTKRKLSLLFLFSTAAMAVFAVRVLYTSSLQFLYMNWNLLLAWVPIILMIIKDRIVGRSLLKVIMLIIVILFLPNSFYVLTDLIHIRETFQIGLWYDVILILFYALSSLLIGYVIAQNFWKTALKYLSKNKAIATLMIFFIVMAFGVYLGRFLRLNSWDVIDPINLFDDIVTEFSSLYYIGRAALFSALYGFIIAIIFFITNND